MAEDTRQLLQFIISAEDQSAPEIRKVQDALKELGLEMNLVVDGMQSSEYKAVAAFKQIGESAKSTGQMISSALVGALDRIQTPAGVEALNRSLVELKSSGRIAGEGLLSLTKSEERLNELTYAAAQGADAFSLALQRQKMAALEASTGMVGLGNVLGSVTAKFVAHQEAVYGSAAAMSSLEQSSNKTANIMGAFNILVNLMIAKEVITRFTDLNDGMHNMERALTAITGSAKETSDTIAFLSGIADRLGVSVLDIGDAYTKMAAAAKGTQLEGAATQKVFSSIVSAMAQVGGTADQTNHALLAISQMMSKGTVSAEELRRQLGESLPGAMQQAAESMFKTNAEFIKMVQSGSVLATEFLPKFADQLDKTFGSGSVRIETMTAQWNRLYNKFVDFANGSIGNAVVDAAKSMVSGLGIVTDAATGTGEAIGGVVKAVAGIVAGEPKEAVEDLGNSFLNAHAKIFGYKTATEAAAERTKQIREELKNLIPQVDRFQDAVDRGELKEFPTHLQEAIGILHTTADAFKATDAAMKKFMEEPVGKLNLDGVIELSTALRAVGNEARTSGNIIQNELAKKLSSLTDDQLTKLEQQARKAMEAAANNANAKRAFAELGLVIESVLMARLQRLGVDAEAAFNRLSIEANESIKDFEGVANSALTTGKVLQQAFDGALEKLDDPKELETFKAKIIELGEQGKLSAEQVDKFLAEIRIQMHNTAEDPSFKLIKQAYADIRQEIERSVQLVDLETKTMDVRIKNALALAKAKGDEAAAAQATAMATKEQLEVTKLKIAQEREEAAQIDLQIQRLFSLANADGNYSDAEREVIEQLKLKSASLKAAADQSEAYLPILQREADQAATMAGPVGQLARLYAEQSREHQLAAQYSTAYYETQLKEIDASIRIAQAKGNEAEVASLLIDKRQLEIDQAEQITAIKAQEAVDAQNLVEVKKLEAMASDGITEAEQRQIDKLQELANAKQFAAQQAAVHVEALKAEKDAAEKESDVFDNASKNAYKFSEAAGDVAKRNEEVGKSADKAKNSLEGVKFAFNEFRGVVGGGFGSDAVGRFANNVYLMKSAIEDARVELQRMAEQGLPAATFKTEQLAKDLMEAKGAGTELAREVGQALTQALENARAEAQGLAEDMANMAEDFERQILQMKGDQRALEEMDYQDSMNRLEEMHKRAGQISNEEYEDAKSKLTELHSLKLRALEEEEAANKMADANYTDAANKTKEAWSGAANEIERAKSAALAVGATDLSGLSSQLTSLGQAARNLAGAL